MKTFTSTRKRATFGWAILTSVLIAGWAVTAQATVVPIVNGDFETVWASFSDHTQQTIIPGAFTAVPGFGLTSWTYYGGGSGPSVSYNPGWSDISNSGESYLLPGAAFNTGQQTGLAGDIGVGSGVGAFQQTLTANLVANSTYTLSFDVGKRLDFGSSWGSTGYQVELLAGATSLLLTGATPIRLPVILLPATLTYISPYNGAVIGQPLTIRFSLLASGQQVFFDNVTLDQVLIPEPSTVLLFGCGGLLLWWRRGRPSRS